MLPWSQFFTPQGRQFGCSALTRKERKALLVRRDMTLEKGEKFVPQDSFDALQRMGCVPAVTFLCHRGGELLSC